MPLTSAQLTTMRTRADAYLLDTCVISYPTHNSDSMGGFVDSWTVRGTVDCYLEVKSVPDLNLSGDTLKTYTEFTLYIDSAGTVVRGDKVVHNSSTYTVEGVVAGKTRRAFKAAKLTLEA